MPDDLKGKIIVTNTITKENIEELRVRNVSALITTTPEFDSRSLVPMLLKLLCWLYLKSLFIKLLMKNILLPLKTWF